MKVRPLGKHLGARIDGLDLVGGLNFMRLPPPPSRPIIRPPPG